MKRHIASILILLALAIVPLYAGTLSYVYGSSLSSVDFSEPPKRGAVFVGGNDNVIVVREIDGNLIRFDKYITRADYVPESALSPRGSIKSLGVYSGLGYSVASFGMTGVTYPFSFSVQGGVTYGKDYGTGAVALAGVDVVVPLSRLWDTSFTLIENGRLHGWCSLGVHVSDAVRFAVFDGVTYSHNFGAFRWELGVSTLDVMGEKVKLSPTVALGVDL